MACSRGRGDGVCATPSPRRGDTLRSELGLCRGDGVPAASDRL